MTRTISAAAFLIVLAGNMCAFAGPDQVATFADDVCEAPFNLVMSADVIREADGLLVVVHDDGAGGRVVFEVAPSGVAVTLHHGGAVVELARADVRLPDSDGQVVLKRYLDGVAVAYDGVTVLCAEADLPDGGRWGVLGASARTLEQMMLQPIDTVIFSDDFMRTTGQSPTWEQLRGDWGVAQLDSARFSANAFTLLGRADDAPSALAAAGYWFFEDLTVEVSVRSSEGGEGFGVGFACHSDEDCYLLRFVRKSGPTGSLQLVRIRDGQETVLDEATAVAHADEWHRLAVSGVRGRLTGALDGAELVAAEDPTLGHGQVALWTAGPEPVAFDDVEAYSGPRRTEKPVVLSYETQSSDPSAQLFIGDRYMQAWADERDQWRSGAGGIWHAGQYWGDVELGWEITERSLGEGAQLHICVPSGEDTFSPPPSADQGCHLALSATDGKLSLILSEGTEARSEAAVTMPQLPAAISLRRRGAVVEALLGDKVLASFEAAVPAAGKVGLTGGGSRGGHGGRAGIGQANQLRIVSHNMMDSTFRAAPTEWHIGSGEWGVSSRWDCTPRWSWFQGRSDDLASVWTRRQFSGDIAVEFFAGISMDQPWAPFYQHPGNLSVTLCGSNDTPGSGYSLAFGGWGNSAAGIFREGELVAKVSGFTMPDILDSLGGTTGREDAHKLHNEWWRIRAERVGTTVRLLVDGKLAASFNDPDPLPGGAVGIWTLAHAMTIARARIYYEQAEHVTPSVEEYPAAQPAAGLPVPSFGPPRVTSTFEQGVAGWDASAPRSCEVALAERDDREGGRCLRVTNPTAGGDFAVTAPFEGVDLRKNSLLAFDYAIPDDVAVDVFATVEGQRYRIALSGPEQPTPGIEDVGRVPDARSDGRWRQGNVDLLGLLTPHFAGAEPILLERLEFAAYAAPEYMRAGIGGNPAGASWRLDNMYLGGVISTPVTLQTQRGVTVEGRGCSVTRDPRVGRAEHQITPQRSGLAAITLTSGGRSAVELLAFDLAAPTIEPREPQPGGTWLGPVMTIALADAGPAGIDERSISLTIGDRRFRHGDSGLQWNAADGMLTLDLRATDLQLSAGNAAPVRTDAADRAGNRAEPVAFAFTADLAADNLPPDAPTLAGLPEPLIDCDFEADLGPIEPWGVDAAVALRRAHDPATDNAAGGQWCLEARSTKLGGLFGISLGCAPFEASRFPVLQFDYRVPEELRVDLVVEVDGRRRVIKFTDNDQTWAPIGRVAAVADGAWHHATIDLQALLSRAFRREAPLVVTEIAFASSGWPGNREGVRCYLDNVQLQAALNADAPPADVTLISADESGIAGFAWTANALSESNPPADVAPIDLQAMLPDLAGELAWVHAVAVDGAGNRSSVAHLPLRVSAPEDGRLPVASAPTPADGAITCPEIISVNINGEGARVSPADLRLSVNDRTWNVADDALAWDGTTGQLTWRLPEGASLGEDGSRVTCRVEGRTLAGDALTPLEWTFTIDHALDAQSPAAPVVSYVPARVADSNDFEAHTGGWGNFVAGQVLRRAEGGATGLGCAELRHLGGRGNGFVLMRDFGEDWREFPMVRFCYRAQNAPRARLEVFGTTFDGTQDRWTPLGSPPASGDVWQTAVIDIQQALARTNPSLDIHRIFLSIDLPPDGTLLVDDYAMYSQVAREASFRWATPTDASGIAGYSWVLDSADDTVPPEIISGAESAATFTDLEPGHYCFHLRARDCAGNWGLTAHVPFDLTAPE